MRIESSLQQSYTKLATGSRINSAANDPSGLAISNKMTSQVNGYDKGTENALSTQDLVKTADSALSSIGDSLSRMKELAVQASNGTYTADDKKNIQSEIDQLKQGIMDTVKGTEFNTMKLVDGSYANKNIASTPSGTGKTMTIQNTSLETLGIKDFDVTGSFDMSSIDNAIKSVSDSRANLGGISNSIDTMVNSNTNASLNLSSAESTIADADIEKAASDLKALNLKQNVQMYAQKQKMNQNANMLNVLG